MTLISLLTILSGNKKLYITLKDTEGNELITFNAAGYQSVESDLGDYTVNSFVINSTTKAEITIENV